MASSNTEIDADTLYGLTALPADQTKTPPVTTTPKSLSVTQIPIPTTPLANRIHAYTRRTLQPKTYAHSLRVYTYGIAIARECFPSFNITRGSKLEETWFLTAMLHDIGTTPHHISTTKLSYEFWAGYHALEILQDSRTTAGGEGVEEEEEEEEETQAQAPRAQAESVVEAIIRHQDVQDKGSITLITRLIHLGTLLDNVGAGKDLVHPDTIRDVNEVYDRTGWSGCFADTVREEKRLKGWAMVSRIEGFEEQIEANGG